MKPPRPQRIIVSFMRHNTRINDSQRAAQDCHRARFLIDVPTAEMDTSIASDAHVDWDAVFGRWAPRIVEIGSRNGDSLVPMAAAHLESDFIAFEVSSPDIASTIGHLGREEVGSVRIVPANGTQGLAVLFDDNSLTELWTFFTDPQHRARHHKRHLVNTEFTNLVTLKLRSGGLWRLVTDWEDYTFWQWETLDVHPHLENLHDDWAPQYEARPAMKYKARGLARSRGVYDLTYRRLP